MQIETTQVAALRAFRGNARTHSKRQIRQIADSMQRFGFTNPVLIDNDGQIIAGHGRVEAAKLLGMRNVPTVRLSHLNEAEKRAYVIADNKLAEKAGWDREILAIELQALTELDFDVELTGFDTAEIDSLLGEVSDPEADPADEVPALEPDAVTKPGDVWDLGRHRLICGDAKDPSAFNQLMGRERAAMVFTDPPYNVKVSSIQGRGRIKHREFGQASGELTREQFTKFLADSLSLAARYSTDGSIHYVCMDWRHATELFAAGRQVYGEPKNLIVWNKTNAGMGSFYRSQHELIFAFKSGEGPHKNNFELGQHGRNRSNVWTYSGINSFGADRMDNLASHPTVKPIALVADAMRDCSRRGDIILDLFMGSGTTILAAERVGRRGYGLELDPLYVDAAVRRWQNFTKRDAVLQGTGQTFDDSAATRAAQPKEESNVH